MKHDLITNYLRRSLLVLSASLLFWVVGSFLTLPPTFAAEQVVARYGFFEQSLPVEDLRPYSEMSQVSAVLQSFLRYFSPKEQQKLQQALQVKMSLDLIALDKLLDTEIGNQFLTEVSPAIARRDKAGIPALRAAVLLGAKSSEGLGVLSFLEAYPSKRLVVDLPKALEVLSNPNLYPNSSEVPPKDTLSSTLLWQLEVQYQILATQGKQYDGCLFGDSITAELGNSLGERTFNFALDGLSTISLVEQLKRLHTTPVKCQKAVIAIGGNDAWYDLSDELFSQKLKKSIALVRSMDTPQIFLIPAFYSTVEASLDASIAAPLKRVEEINTLIEKIAATEEIPVEAQGIQSLYEKNALKENLTSDGDHLNAEGLKIYRRALLNILNSSPEKSDRLS
ncbi:MAG TPA: alpha/beta hydrolase [Waterburya sp.]|jgi:lysophospholipase L1-like esterase